MVDTVDEVRRTMVQNGPTWAMMKKLTGLECQPCVLPLRLPVVSESALDLHDIRNCLRGGLTLGWPCDYR